MTTLQRIQPEVNAYQFSFDEKLLGEMREAYASSLLPIFKSSRLIECFKGGKSFRFEIEENKQKYFLVSYGEAPLMWISNNSLDAYGMFERFFDSLNIKEEVKKLVDFDKEITMYCGFFVVGNHLDKEAWHVDYSNGANAYTLLTPLFELDKRHGHLLYRNEEESEPRRYAYKVGKAVLVGDHLLHTTEIYPETSEIRVLVSLTFGTDKLQYWDILKETIGGQSKYMVLPCGHVKDTCECLNKLSKTNRFKKLRPAVKLSPFRNPKEGPKTPMTITRNTLVVQAKEQVSADLQGDVAILNLKNSVYYGVDAVGPRIWHLIREPKSVSEILDALLSEYEVERECCEKDLLAFLEKLSKEGLIEIRDEKVS